MNSFRATNSPVMCGPALLIACFLTVPAVASANTGQDAATRQFQKTLPLAAGQTLSIENKFGEIRIHGENSHEAIISATIRSQAGSQAQAEKFAESMQIEVNQDAHGISIRTVVSWPRGLPGCRSCSPDTIRTTTSGSGRGGTRGSTPGARAMPTT